MVHSKDKKYCVYKHTSPIGRVYIGMTSKEPTLRWVKGNGYRDNKDFYNDIKKYTWDAFEHEILFSGLPKEEATLMEAFYIAIYESTNKKLGYNKSIGMDRKGKDTIMKISKKVICINTGMTFNSLRLAAKYYGYAGSNAIIESCKTFKLRDAKGHKSSHYDFFMINGIGHMESYYWAYYDEYINKVKAEE